MTMQSDVPAEPPDADVIDAQYQQFEAKSRALDAQVSRLGQMLHQGATAGNPGAKAWLPEFRTIANQIKEEQALVQTLLHSMHQLTAYALHQAEEAYASMGWQEEPGGSPAVEAAYATPAAAPASAGGFEVGTLPGQTAGALPGQPAATLPPRQNTIGAGGYVMSSQAQAHPQSSTDWASGPEADPNTGMPYDPSAQPKGRSMLKKLATGAGVAAGTLGILHSPAYSSTGRAQSSYSKGQQPFQRRGLFGGQAARQDDQFADDAAADAPRAQQGGQLERFLKGSLGRSVRGGGGGV